MLHFPTKYGYKIIVYDFGPGDENTLIQLLRSRMDSRVNWQDVFNENLKDYQKPTMEEGFHEIVRIEKSKY